MDPACRTVQTAWMYTMLTFLLVFHLLYAFAPGGATAAALSDDSDVQSVYEQLKSGKRLINDKEYVLPDKPTVYLTFDDGPSKLTDRVLDILKENEIQATFFTLGNEAEGHPDTIRRIVSEGHALGNHTYDHVYKELYGSFDQFWGQVQKTEQILFDIAGVRPRLLRAPGGTYGNFDPFYFYYLDRAGYSVFDWTIDSGDARRSGVKADEIIRTVEKGPFHHEVVLLMHDGSGHDETVKALPAIIQLFKDKGYTFAPLTDRVKPPLLALGKPKWPRSYSEEAFASTLGTASRHAWVFEPKPHVQEPEASQAEPGVPLFLQLGENKVEVDSGWNWLKKDGHLYVPLRLLVENMGGYVSWDAERRTAFVSFGKYLVQYDLIRHQIRLLVPGYKFQIYEMANMELYEGSIIVPLRSTLEMLGNEITHYALGPAERQVTVSLHRPPYG
jgi:peptidoglycan/xylan/chitin deacetylase (PgdA/CDA1 family)